MKKQPEITDKTRNCFVSVFCKLYSEKPIEKISVQEITRTAGYNRSTFYQYFTDIYDLLAYVENDVLAYIRATALDNFTGNEVSNLFVQRVSRFYLDKGDYLKALIGDYGSIHFIERLKGELKLELLQITILKNNNALAPYLMEIYLTSVISVFRLWHSRQKDIAIEQVVSLIQMLLENTIVPLLR